MVFAFKLTCLLMSLWAFGSECNTTRNVFSTRNMHGPGSIASCWDLGFARKRGGSHGPRGARFLDTTRDYMNQRDLHTSEHQYQEPQSYNGSKVSLVCRLPMAPPSSHYHVKETSLLQRLQLEFCHQWHFDDTCAWISVCSSTASAFFWRLVFAFYLWE